MEPFHSINAPIFSSPQPAPEGQSAPTEEPEESAGATGDAEARIISAEWIPGPEGFIYNDSCYLDVKTELIDPDTVRLRVSGQLFTTYNDEEEDLDQPVEGFIERESQVARLEIKRLWFGKQHHQAYQSDTNAACSYIIKTISHSRGENSIDSPVLEMPQPPHFPFSY
jgi:hypothetical protein